MNVVVNVSFVLVLFALRVRVFCDTYSSIGLECWEQCHFVYVSLVEKGLLGIALDVLAAVLSMCKRVYDQGGGGPNILGCLV